MRSFEPMSCCSSGSKTNSSSSSSSPAAGEAPTGRRSTDEVWNNVTLTAPHVPCFRGRAIVVQDFLAGAVGDAPAAPLSRGGVAQLPHTALILGSPRASLESSFVSGELPCAKKRAVESDPRFERVVKNRESAARSRARKQAYNNELELKVAHLQEENARLRKLSDELRLAMAAQMTPKNKLERSFSASF